MASRVVRVRSTGDGVAAHRPARRHRRDPGGARRSRRSSPQEVEQAAAAAAASPRLPELDRTDIPFVTIDPEGLADLDQALHLERAGDGYVVHYAIADVAAFVAPGDPVDVEANRRGETLYGADSKVPLHPTVLSRGRRLAAARPGAPGAAVDDQGRRDRRGHRRRRSSGRWCGRAPSSTTTGCRPTSTPAGRRAARLLKEVGELRLAREAARGGVSLPLPEQEVDVRRRALGSWSSARCCRSRSGTPRSRCSPAWPLPR